MANVRAHGGPCSNAGDVDRVLEMSSGSRLEIVKNEIRYLKVILGVKDKRLVFGKKKLATLTVDLKSVLSVADPSVCDPGSVPSVVEAPVTSVVEAPVASVVEAPVASVFEAPVASVFEAPVPEIEQPASHDASASGNVLRQDKRKLAGDTRSNKKSKVDLCILKPDLGSFKYSKKDSWVAVAYEEGFFVGIVSEVKSESLGVIQFLTRGPRNVFRWPTIDDITTIESEFVFAYDFEVSSMNGQTYRVPELNYIEDLYEEFSSTFFVDIDL